MVEARIDLASLARFKNDVHAGIHVLDELRRVGIPVRGVLFPRGVDNGSLTVTDDEVFGDQVWTWTP